MKTPPQAFLIFKEELKKAKVEKKKLESEYEAKIMEMHREMAFLKEQIAAQQQMMKTTVEYATKLEKDLEALQQQIVQDKKRQNRSFH